MRILYGVAGEGSGHAIRSKPILNHLSKNHEILIIGGGRAYTLLSKYYKAEEIYAHKIITDENSVKNKHTIWHAIKNLYPIIKSNLKVAKTIIKFKPDLIITDFEPSVSYASLLFKKPCISIDNMHILTNSKLEISENLIDELIAKIIIRFWIPKANYFLITSFFYPKKISKNTFLFPPINRNEILKLKPKNKNHIVIYQSYPSFNKIIPKLRLINEKFIIYGLNENKKIGNIQLKKFHENNWISDLNNSKAVICSGGFTTIGEALHLKKPILAIPIRKHFEQIVNSLYIEKLGYGKYSKNFHISELKDFISNLEVYRKNLKNYKKEDNSKILKKLDELIKIYNQP